MMLRDVGWVRARVERKGADADVVLDDAAGAEEGVETRARKSTGGNACSATGVGGADGGD